jgi:pSer/pThr/pTyr-binding forkhead associated (FHA) protein
MAFVVVYFRDEEISRRELSGPLVIGRSPDCDISVRDIILSRHHCRLVPADRGWAVEDMGSKNGTHINGESLKYAILKDGASIRIGKTQLKFYTGSTRQAPAPRKKPVSSSSRQRPATPFDAMAGTVTDFVYVAEGPERDVSKLPSPRPHPADPTSYANEDVYTMLTEIASSSWDSIYATASEPAAVMVAGQKQRPLPVAGAKVVASDAARRQRHLPTDPSLQVVHTEPVSQTAKTKILKPAAPAAVHSRSPAPQPAPSSKWLHPVRSVFRGMKHIFTGRIFRRAS